MKRFALIAAVASAFACSAYAASDFVDTAEVMSSRPRIERVTETRQQCDPVPAQRSSNGGSNVVAPILGGVVGGLIGHQVGQGRGQTAATIVGAAGGAVAGSAIADRANQNSQPQQQCRTVETSREVVNGYDVVYRYNGRESTIVLPYNPGSTIKVGVSAIPEQAPPPAPRASDNYSRPRDDRAVRDTNPPPGQNGGNYQYRY